MDRISSGIAHAPADLGDPNPGPLYTRRGPAAPRPAPPPGLAPRGSRDTQEPSSPPRLKLDPKQRCMLTQSRDWVDQRDARILATDHRLPPARVFADPGAGVPRTTPLGPQALASLTMKSRLDLNGHGGADNFGGLTPGQLADKLADAGLREVGVIKSYACKNGAENFLAELKDRLTERGVSVGYLAGFKTKIYMDKTPMKVFGVRFNAAPLQMLGVPATVVSGTNFTRASRHMTVVKGNVDVRFGGTRYDLPPEPAATPVAPPAGHRTRR